MTLTLEQVRQTRFHLARRNGYEPVDVDSFVDKVEATLTQLTEENATLKQQVDALSSSEPSSIFVPGDSKESDQLKADLKGRQSELEGVKGELAQRTQELERGLTLTGPHRDDLVLRVRDLPVKGYASHGESWSFALALRLASAELLLHESPSGDPVLILDDVFAELDADRRQRLASLTADYEQVVVTAAVEEDIPEVLHRHGVRISNGTISDERSGSSSAQAIGEEGAHD